MNVCMYAQMCVCLQKPEEGFDFLDLELQILWAALHGSLDLNSGPVQEQQVFLTSSFQPMS